MCYRAVLAWDTLAFNQQMLNWRQLCPLAA